MHLVLLGIYTTIQEFAISFEKQSLLHFTRVPLRFRLQQHGLLLLLPTAISKPLYVYSSTLNFLVLKRAINLPHLMFTDATSYLVSWLCAYFRTKY